VSDLGKIRILNLQKHSIFYGYVVNYMNSVHNSSSRSKVPFTDRKNLKIQSLDFDENVFKML